MRVTAVQRQPEQTEDEDDYDDDGAGGPKRKVAVPGMAKPRKTLFYATAADLREGLKRAEAMRPLKYVRRGLFPEDEPSETSQGRELPGLGISEAGEINLQNFYLVVDAGVSVKVRPVPQRRGGILYAVDEVANPSAAVFVPGGLHHNCVIVGKVMAPGDPRSQELYRLVTREVTRGFTRRDVYFIGPEAFNLWEQGYRLTHNARAPADYDLPRG